MRVYAVSANIEKGNGWNVRVWFVGSSCGESTVSDPVKTTLTNDRIGDARRAATIYVPRLRTIAASAKLRKGKSALSRVAEIGWSGGLLNLIKSVR